MRTGGERRYLEADLGVCSSPGTTVVFSVRIALARDSMLMKSR
jgi:hypothetical protein